MSATANDGRTSHTAPADEPSAGVRVAEFLDSLLPAVAESLAEPSNRVWFRRWVAGVLDRARFVRAEKLAEIAVRVGVSAVAAFADRVFEQLDNEALEALARGE